MDAFISLSILGYESCLNKRIENIRKLLSSGIEWLHIDVMRHPFIPGTNAFDKKSISLLYDKFACLANFDFHLMTFKPHLEIKIIDKIISDADKKNTIITIHREAYRKGLGKYNSKEYDLLNINTGNSSLDKRLKAANMESGKLVYETLKNIKEHGYKIGIALEPGTSLNNISDEIADIADIILLMSVSSGAGGHAFNPEVIDKIKEASKRYGHRKMIQVDGGIDDKVLPKVIKAGANNVVIGSYITKAENPAGQLSKIKKFLKKGKSEGISSL